MSGVGASLNRFCGWLQGAAKSVCTPPVEDCARWDTVADTVCDAFDTITTTICDAMATVTQTICDATQTVTQTVCDATRTVTESVCDAVRSIPLIGSLICFLSHVVSHVVCAASHIVATVVCTASHVVSSLVCAASHVVSNLVCAVSHVVSKTLCAGWTIVKAAACVVVGGAANLTCAVISKVLGPGPILRSATQDAGSVARTETSARSFVLATDLTTVDVRSPYDEEGIHIAYRLVDGRAEWAIGPGAQFQAIVPDPMDIPSFAAPPPGGGPLAVSYDVMRLGDWSDPPVFDMIAAGGDRAIAKKQGTDEIFVCVTCNPYIHRVGERRVILPQSYFKLDPELGLETARIADLIAHVTIAGDDERHPATERFPLFRALFNLGGVRVTLPAPLRRIFGVSQINVRLFKGAGELGLMQEMDARFPPRIWHKVDLRPPRDGNEPPARFAPYQYEHVVYASNDEPGAQELVRHSIGYTRVLDLGVGLSHLYEQHDNRFGGELDNLKNEQWKLFGVLRVGDLAGSPPADVSDDAAYQFANGPIQDYGGWVDGTSIYYMLVQLKPDDELAAADPASLKGAFAILWTDEQTAFTERWRALHLDDNQFKSPFKPMVAVLPSAASRFYPEAQFDAARSFCPLTEGHVTPASRMVVSRQIVVVSGRDPETGTDELYSIHFAWPTMDRTWRRRALPPAAVTSSHARDQPRGAVVFRDTLQIREDSTLLLGGAKDVDGVRVTGRWFQRYLPADGQESPSIPELEAEPAGARPAPSYAHPWSFVSDAVAEIADERFSHFGVYEPVRSRIQFYQVTPDSPLEPAEIENTVWEDTRHSLQKAHKRLDWAAAADILNGGDPALAVSSRTHPSISNDPMSFRLAQRPEFGWTLTHFDKRDDKLVAFDGVGTPRLASVVLSDRDDPARTITLSVDMHFRNPVRDLHGRTVSAEVDAVSPPQVRTATVRSTPGTGGVASVTIALDVARASDAANAYGDFQTWLAINLWRVKIGAIIPRKPGSTQREPVILFDRERAGVFTAAGDTRFTFVWTPTAADQREGLLARLLSEAGRIEYGTSIWFVGATGLACCADETVFELGGD